MKCVFVNATKKIVKMSDDKANELVRAKKGEYRSKSEWKNYVKNAEKVKK